MPRRSKGPRLYLREARENRGSAAVWVIRDGKAEISTGCGDDGVSVPEDAQNQLADYIAKKWKPPAPGSRPGDPALVYVAEVLAFYAQTRAPDLESDAASITGWISALLAFEGWDTLADVKLSTCKAYVAWRCTHRWKQAKTAERYVTVAGARRELEVLSGAITHWAKEHPLSPRPVVTLPPKGQSQRDALTRSEAAALLWAAMGWRKGADGVWTRLGASARANRAHLRRFVLMGVYTGSRPTVQIRMLWSESAVRAYADLDARTIFRRGRDEREQRTKRRPLVKITGRLLAHMRRWKRLDELAGLETNVVIHHGGHELAGLPRTGFAGIVRDAGLNPDITPHWLRHTCATWLMEGGADLWDAAGFAGMSAAVLEKHYGHHRPDHQAAARKALR